MYCLRRRGRLMGGGEIPLYSIKNGSIRKSVDSHFYGFEFLPSSFLCSVYFVRNTTKEEAVKQNKKSLLLCSFKIGKPCSSRPGLKKDMQRLKSRDRTALEKKKENKFWLWNESLFEVESAPQLGSWRMRYNTLIFSYENISQSSFIWHWIHVPKRELPITAKQKRGKFFIRK